MARAQEEILVIKLSALGDFMLAMGCFKSIRLYHKQARITLLTTKTFEKLALDCGYFDEVLIDERPARYDILGLKRLRQQLRSSTWVRIYDLQINGRSTFYHRLLWDIPFIKRGKRPFSWAGIDKKGDFYTHDQSSRDHRVHAIKRNEAVLLASGFPENQIFSPDLSWLKSELTNKKLPNKNALLITGCSPKHPDKRWPKEHFAELAANLFERGITPVLIGGNTEVDINKWISEQVPGAVNLTNQTSLADLASLSRQTIMAIGNDTGPTHIIAMAGALTLSLFSLKASNPDKSAPIGPKVTVLSHKDINQISAHQVLERVLQKEKD